VFVANAGSCFVLSVEYSVAALQEHCIESQQFLREFSLMDGAPHGA
jgi:hypothetical protein